MPFFQRCRLAVTVFALSLAAVPTLFASPAPQEAGGPPPSDPFGSGAEQSDSLRMWKRGIEDIFSRYRASRCRACLQVRFNALMLWPDVPGSDIQVWAVCDRVAVHLFLLFPTSLRSWPSLLPLSSRRMIRTLVCTASLFVKDCGFSNAVLLLILPDELGADFRFPLRA